MPAIGDQHKLITNPFEEPQRRISEYTAQEIATLQSRLEKQLGPEYLSSRAGPSGQKVHYISSEKCIQLANEVFGFNGWSSSIQNIQVDFVDEHPQTLKINMGISVIMRVTLRDGTYHEDLGYGHIENCKGKAAAFEKAKKEATTDALKRALRQFGNVLGNCIYDKQYLAKVTKMKVEPTKFAEDNLHRHSDFVKKEPVEAPDVMRIDSVGIGARPPALENEESFEDLLGELDEADFNMADEGHPDEVVLPQSVHNSLNDKPVHQQLNNLNPQAQQSRPLTRSGSTGSLNIRQQPQTSNQFTARAQNRPPQQQFNNNNQSRPSPMGQPANNFTNTNTSNNNAQNYSTPQKPAPAAPALQAGASAGAAAVPAPETVGFFSAKAVTQLPEEALASGQVAPTKPGLAFNPHAESPSIRKTPGIDHTKSKPLARNGQHVPPAKTTATSEAEGGESSTTSFSRPAGAQNASRPVTVSEARSRAGAGPPLGGGNVGKNVINPQLDQTRRIGAPGAGMGGGFSSSPSGNRGQYRPLTMKRPATAMGGAGGAGGAGQTNKDGGNGDGSATGATAANAAAAGSVTGASNASGGGGGNAGGRVPLTDMSANSSNATATAAGAGAGGPEVKRQRMA